MSWTITACVATPRVRFAYPGYAFGQLPPEWLGERVGGLARLEVPALLPRPGCRRLARRSSGGAGQPTLPLTPRARSGGADQWSANAPPRPDGGGNNPRACTHDLGAPGVTRRGWTMPRVRCACPGYAYKPPPLAGERKKAGSVSRRDA